jgi:hypothetical protein
MKKKIKYIVITVLGVAFLGIVCLFTWFQIERQIDTNKANKLYSNLIILPHTDKQTTQNTCVDNQNVFGGHVYCQTEFDISYSSNQIANVITKLKEIGYTETLTYNGTASNDVYIFDNYANRNEIEIYPSAGDPSIPPTSWQLIYSIHQFDLSPLGMTVFIWLFILFLGVIGIVVGIIRYISNKLNNK